MARKPAPVYHLSMRCHYRNGTDESAHYTQHHQDLPLRDIPKWIEAYRFTHPECTSISAKVWFTCTPDPDEDA